MKPFILLSRNTLFLAATDVSIVNDFSIQIVFDGHYLLLIDVGKRQ